MAARTGLAVAAALCAGACGGTSSTGPAGTHTPASPPPTSAPPTSPPPTSRVVGGATVTGTISQPGPLLLVRSSSGAGTVVTIEHPGGGEQVVVTLPGPDPASVSAPSADGHLLIAAGKPASYWLLDRSGAVSTLPAAAAAVLQGADLSDVDESFLMADGHTAVLVAPPADAHGDFTVEAVDLVRGSVTSLVTGAAADPNTPITPLSVLAVSNDGAAVWVREVGARVGGATVSGSLVEVPLHGGATLATHPDPAAPIPDHNVAISTDGSHYASFASVSTPSGQAQQVMLTDLGSGASLRSNDTPLFNVPGNGNPLRFSPDGSHLVVRGDVIGSPPPSGEGGTASGRTALSVLDATTGRGTTFLDIKDNGHNYVDGVGWVDNGNYAYGVEQIPPGGPCCNFTNATGTVHVVDVTTRQDSAVAGAAGVLVQVIR